MNNKKCLDCGSILGPHNCYASHIKYSKYVCKSCARERSKLKPSRKAYHKQYGRQHYKNNKARYREKSKAYKANNPDVRRENTARYKANKLQRTPNWCDIPQIKKIYKECPKGLTVDHIIPMQGEFVSGLNVPENLQYLDLSTNSSKRIFFDSADYQKWLDNGGLKQRFTAPYLPPYLRANVA